MNVTFRIKKSKLDLLVDSFGLNIHPHEYNDELYECTVKTTDKAALIFAQKYIDVVELHTPAKLSHLIRTLRATLSGDTEPVNPAMRATLPNRDYSECCMRMLIRHFSY